MTSLTPIEFSSPRTGRSSNSNYLRKHICVYIHIYIHTLGRSAASTHVSYMYIKAESHIQSVCKAQFQPQNEPYKYTSQKPKPYVSNIVVQRMLAAQAHMQPKYGCVYIYIYRERERERDCTQCVCTFTRGHRMIDTSENQMGRFTEIMLLKAEV